MIQTIYSKTDIAKLVKAEYDFNWYSITQEQLVSIVEVFSGTIEKFDINDKIVAGFFVDLHCGKLGVMFKAPSDIVAKFYKYCDEKRIKLSV